MDQRTPSQRLPRAMEGPRRGLPLREDAHVEVIVVNLVGEVVRNRVVEPPRTSELPDVMTRHQPLG